MSECVKETKCTSCFHRTVCMHKIYFLRICEAVDRAKIYEKTEHGYCEHPISSYDCFGGVDVKCKYYAIDTVPREDVIVETDPDNPWQLIKRGEINTCSNHT